MESEEIVILGAGLAGLTAAYGLESRGISYQVLEARERIGGRVHTITTETGATIEMGATWFADKHIHLMELIKKLEVPYQQQYTGSSVLYDYANPDRTAQLFALPANNEAQYLFSEGTQSLVEALHHMIKPQSIQLGQHVRKLAFEEDQVLISVNDRKVKAKRVINTLPPNLFINTIEVTPGLPESLVEVLSKTHTWMGESIKAGLEYPTDFWRSHEIGTLLSQFGPAQELHDHSHEGKAGNVLKGFINSDLHMQGREAREEKVLDQMRFYFGPELPIPKYYEADWRSESFTFYPYSSEVMPHQHNGNPMLRESFFDNRLYFAGSETAQVFPGYLDGAVERGNAIVQAIANELITKKATKLS